MNKFGNSITFLRDFSKCQTNRVCRVEKHSFRFLLFFAAGYKYFCYITALNSFFHTAFCKKFRDMKKFMENIDENMENLENMENFM